MSIFSKPSSVARTSVIYVTVGALTEVWSGIWFWYLRNHLPSTETTFYWCYGFLLSGVTLMLIGLVIGRIGWIGGDAHQAELHRVEWHHEELHRQEATHTTQAEMTAVPKTPSLVTVGPAEIPLVTEGG